MIIYKITHLESKKVYIGQTTSCFNRRYPGGKWWIYTDNDILKNYAEKYGHESFCVEILEEGVESLERLNELEEFYADKFDCYHPNGFNLRGCGDNRRLLPHQIEMIKNVKSKEYEVIKIDTWQKVKFKNAREFCRKNNLSHCSFYNMLNQNLGIIVSQGYCLSIRTKNEVLNRKKRKNKKRKAKFLGPNDELIIVDDVASFIRDNGLEQGSFYKMLRGEMLFYRGYKLQSKKSVFPKNFKKVEVCFRFEKTYTFESISSFARFAKINATSAHKLISGKRKYLNGWHLPSTTKDDILSSPKLKQLYSKEITSLNSG